MPFSIWLYCSITAVILIFFFFFLQGKTSLIQRFLDRYCFAFLRMQIFMRYIFSCKNRQLIIHLETLIKSRRNKGNRNCITRISNIKWIGYQINMKKYTFLFSLIQWSHVENRFVAHNWLPFILLRLVCGVTNIFEYLMV